MERLNQRVRWTVGILAVLVITVAAGVRAADLDGEWSFTLSAPEGEHTFSITLAVDGEKITGTRSNETFTGTLKDGQVELSGDHYIDMAGYSAPFKMSGELEGNRITGEGTWDTYSVSVVGERAD